MLGRLQGPGAISRGDVSQGVLSPSRILILPLLHVLILAIVQGITEFLPISSSGHLVLTWELFDRAGWAVPEQDNAHRMILNVAVHVGTLLAVCLYFWRDIAQMIVGVVKLAVGQTSPGARLALYIVLGSIPLVIVGYFFKAPITALLQNVQIVAWATIVFAVILFAADRMGMTVRRIEHMTTAGALFVGLAQVLALIPGTSRAGITMTAARVLGYERPEAARFSMLLAIPAILGAGTLAGLDLVRINDARIGMDAIVAAAIACVVALAAIALMIRWLRRANFTPFVIYRIALGVALLVWLG